MNDEDTCPCIGVVAGRLMQKQGSFQGQIFGIGPGCSTSMCRRPCAIRTKIPWHACLPIGTLIGGISRGMASFGSITGYVALIEWRSHGAAYTLSGEK